MEHNQSNSGLDQCHDCGVRRKQVANPTTNYGFVLPTPTDLVTDLPADFDVALQGVDTQLKALNPSTTLGDIEYRSSTANTNTRLPIGTTDQVLKVSGGVPAWGSVPAPSFVGCMLYNTTTIANANGSGVAITFNTEYFDTDAFHSTSTNTERITIPAGKAGKYLVIGNITWDQSSGGTRELAIRKNGTDFAYCDLGGFGASKTTVRIHMIMDLAVSDYISMTGFQNSGSSLNIVGQTSGVGYTTFGAQYLGV
jgi:hypothetical protein